MLPGLHYTVWQTAPCQHYLVYACAEKHEQHAAVVRGKQTFRFIAPGLDVIELLEPNVQINKSNINDYFFLKI